MSVHTELVLGTIYVQINVNRNNGRAVFPYQICRVAFVITLAMGGDPMMSCFKEL